jgi:DNA-binding transcriptional regulator YiaG
MANLSSVLKSEIIRISKKEISAAIKPLKDANISLKKTVTELKKRISALESENKKLLLNTTKKEEPQSVPENVENLRITSKTVHSLRKKLGLSQEMFGKLLGVSSNAVHTMEHKKGQLKPRTATLTKLLEIKSMGKREVLKILEGMK